MHNFGHRPLQRSFYFCVLALALVASLKAQEAPLDKVKIQVDPKTVVSRISPDFIGFGYETSAVAQTNYFGGKNATLIQLYRNLSDHGLIRIGGCASDNTRYVPDGTPVVRPFTEVSIINQKKLADLGDFAHAAGWKVMWGLNLGHGTKEEAVAEARAVDAALGNNLHSFEVGNEVEALSKIKGNFETFHAAYLDFKSGIRAVLPNASFSGPDSIGHWDFIDSFVHAEAGDMKLLTQHYYCSDAHNPQATIDRMLTRDASFESRLKQLQQLGREKQIPFRINEVNSFSGGGKVGVSDTFASALWCLDYMFMLASDGCDGVNMETDINHLAWISHYSPIVHDPTGKCTACPEYYGMLAFALAGKGDLLKLNLDRGDINLSAYATNDGSGNLWVTVINKDFSKNADVAATLPDGYTTAEAFRLKAPSIESKDQVTLANAEVTADGKWTPGLPEPVQVNAGTAHLSIPHASAVLLRLRL